jgi:hypothetical protein
MKLTGSVRLIDPRQNHGLLIHRPNPGEFVGILYGEVQENDLTHEGKHCRVDSDPQRQSHDGDPRVPLVSQQRTNGIPEILNPRPPRPFPLTPLVGFLLQVSELILPIARGKHGRQKRPRPGKRSLQVPHPAAPESRSMPSQNRSRRLRARASASTAGTSRW